MATYLIDKQRSSRRRVVAVVILGILMLGGIAGYYVYILQRERDPVTVDPAETTETNVASVDVGFADSLFLGAEQPAVSLSEIYDNQRRADIDTISTLLNTFQRTNSFYPRMTQMNSAAFRAEQFGNVPETTFQDPEDTDSRAVFTRTPQERVYFYNVVDANGYTCEPINRQCVNYTVGVILADGSIYELSSLE